MTDHAIISIERGPLQDAINTYLADRNPHTARAYAQRISRFIDWYQQRPPGEQFVLVLKHYMEHLTEEGLSKRSRQAHLTTIKGLIRTAAALDASLSAALPSIDLVKPPKVQGEIQGTRLSSSQRQVLIDAPDTTTHKGRRDKAILGLLSVCGMRRSEICDLNWSHLTEQEGHRIIKDLYGKHGRARTIKLPPALWRLIDRYARQAELDRSPDAPVFVRIRRYDAVQHGDRLTTDAIAYIVKEYTSMFLDDVSPHDLRRTAAYLARRRGATIEQVQVMLGHASPQTTSAYIGETLDLDNNAVDFSDVKW